jgi:hypothetical protein
MDRCSGCGGSLTTAGCINSDCALSRGGTYVNGKKTHTASGRALNPIPGVTFIDDWPCHMGWAMVTRCRHPECKPAQ